jgi:hypothetical protein
VAKGHGASLIDKGSLDETIKTIEFSLLNFGGTVKAKSIVASPDQVQARLREEKINAGSCGTGRR